MRQGDIYVVSLDPIEGREQAGERPVLIVSPGDFNRLTGTPLVVPITGGGNFARIEGFTVSLTGTGLQTTGIVLCNQPRALDVAARKGRRIESAPDYIVEEVINKIATLLEPEPKLGPPRRARRR